MTQYGGRELWVVLSLLLLLVVVSFLLHEAVAEEAFVGSDAEFDVREVADAERECTRWMCDWWERKVGGGASRVWDRAA